MSFPRGAYVNKEEIKGHPKDCDMVPSLPKKDQITPPPPVTDSKAHEKDSSDDEPHPAKVVAVSR